MGHCWPRKIQNANHELLSRHPLLCARFWHHQSWKFLPSVPVDWPIQLLLWVPGQKHSNCGEQVRFGGRKESVRDGDWLVLHLDAVLLRAVFSEERARNSRVDHDDNWAQFGSGSQAGLGQRWRRNDRQKWTRYFFNYSRRNWRYQPAPAQRQTQRKRLLEGKLTNF